MPEEEVTGPVTDQEMHFGRLILSGTMTDRQAAEAAGLNPDTAAETKSKPSVRDYMLRHRAAVEKQLVELEVEEQRRQKQVRERVLARLWKIADLDPEMTRNSASAQMKAISLIVAIEGLIPTRSRDGSAHSRQQPDTSSVAEGFYKAAWMRQQQEPTGDAPPAPAQPQAAPDLQPVAETPAAPPPAAASANCPRVPGAAFVPETRLPFSINRRFGPPR
jgi:hypothetical protein